MPVHEVHVFEEAAAIADIDRNIEHLQKTEARGGWSGGGVLNNKQKIHTKLYFIPAHMYMYVRKERMSVHLVSVLSQVVEQVATVHQFKDDEMRLRVETHSKQTHDVAVFDRAHEKGFL